LEFLQFDAPEIYENSDVHQTDSLDANYTSGAQTQIPIGDMKTIITKLSEKEPRVLLDILKSVIAMIETRDVLECKGTALIGVTCFQISTDLCDLISFIRKGLPCFILFYFSDLMLVFQFQGSCSFVCTDILVLLVSLYV
jgi:ribosomal biogenesis protein LAS1